jgi:hypothetical protein
MLTLRYTALAGVVLFASSCHVFKSKDRESCKTACAARRWRSTTSRVT